LAEYDHLEGTIDLSTAKYYVLFDSGSSHSFISRQYVLECSFPLTELEKPLEVVTPLGGSARLEHYVKGFQLDIAGWRFTLDLIMMGFTGFHIILGMDWMNTNHVSLDLAQRQIHFSIPGYPPFSYHCRNNGESVLSSFLFSVELPTQDIHDVPIVLEFEDVFQDIPGLPPRREVEFRIDLIPGSAPISKPFYRLPPKQLEEMRSQLAELQEKG
jgi:hypothetical protein